MNLPDPDWQTDDGSVKLWCADCMDILPLIEKGSVDAVVTDPPYGIEFQSHGHLFLKSREIRGDDSLASLNWVRNWAEEIGICCCMFFSPFVPTKGWRNVLCWAKGAHVGIGGDRETCWKRDFELIGIERNGPLEGCRDSSVLRFNAVLPPPSGHVAEKPVALMEYLVWKLNTNCAIDPFLGSGTTGVACVRLGRKFMGIEKEPKYFDISVNRIKDALGQEVKGKDGLIQRRMFAEDAK